MPDLRQRKAPAGAAGASQTAKNKSRNYPYFTLFFPVMQALGSKTLMRLAVLLSVLADALAGVALRWRIWHGGGPC